MLLIFGLTKTKVKYRGSTGIQVCPTCYRTAEWGSFRVTRWFHIFFVPVFPVKYRDVTACPICGQRLRRPWRGPFRQSGEPFLEGGAIPPPTAWVEPSRRNVVCPGCGVVRKKVLDDCPICGATVAETLAASAEAATRSKQDN